MLPCLQQPIDQNSTKCPLFIDSFIRALQTDDLNMAERLLTLSKIEADTFSDRSYLSPSIFRSTTSDRLAACVGLVRIQDDCMIGLATVSVISPP